MFFKSGKVGKSRHVKKSAPLTFTDWTQVLTVTYLCCVPNQFRWQVGAACKGVPSYIFFPEERAFEGFKENPLFLGKKAKDFCETCPVREICREFSVLHDMEGIWGDTTDGQRSRRYPRGERFEMRDDQEELGLYEPLYGHS